MAECAPVTAAHSVQPSSDGHKVEVAEVAAGKVCLQAADTVCAPIVLSISEGQQVADNLLTADQSPGAALLQQLQRLVHAVTSSCI